MTWYEILFLKYLKGLPTRINMLLRTYVNGTEQLLPVNDDEPETSPILCDIQYQNALRNDQYFTYRESPTTKDGLAKIRGIKGNTLVWNQLVANDTTSVTLTSGHVYITVINGVFTRVNGTGQSVSVTGGTDNVFDLTKMFGSGNEPETVAEFTSLFPLPYYAYNTGSLLSFTGTGIKVTGKNLLTSFTLPDSRDITATEDNGIYTLNGTSTGYASLIAPTSFFIEPGTYTLSKNSEVSNNEVKVQLRSADGLTTYMNVSSSNQSYTFAERTEAKLRITVSNGITLNNYVVKPQLQIGSEATSFEPYHESTLSLPISTYFPTGMKSAGNVYDELTPTKAITRVGSVDISTCNVQKYDVTQGTLFRIVDVSNAKYGYDNLNVKCASYPTVKSSLRVEKTLSVTERGFDIIDSNYSTIEAFKSAMSGVYLFYELATPTEQSVSPEDTQAMLNQALSTILGRSVSVQNPQEPLDILTKGE